MRGVHLEGWGRASTFPSLTSHGTLLQMPSLDYRSPFFLSCLFECLVTFRWLNAHVSGIEDSRTSESGSGSHWRGQTEGRKHGQEAVDFVVSRKNPGLVSPRKVCAIYTVQELLRLSEGAVTSAASHTSNIS